MPPVRRLVWLVACLAAPVAAVAASAGPDGQLETVRQSIRALERRLEVLRAESEGAAAERARLNAELALAEARVEELELVLEGSRSEAESLRRGAEQLAVELEQRRAILRRHLEMVSLVGRPGPLQLLWDAASGGDLEAAVGTVSVLTTAQLRLLAEYDELQTERNRRLAELSRTLETARVEAASLVERRQELERTRAQVEARLRELSRTTRSTGDRLAEMREREQALERLMSVVSSRRRVTPGEDIRRYRGALPWPTGGRVVQEFGRHYLPRYATYTVCNGLRFDVATGAPVTAVFPGIVAYARHFKGYGNMVVLDHGNDVYSLVAGLATILVRVDQRVEMGARLGLASTPDEGGNLYFEIRLGDAPQNPRRWLQLMEGS